MTTLWKLAPGCHGNTIKSPSQTDTCSCVVSPSLLPSFSPSLLCLSFIPLAQAPYHLIYLRAYIVVKFALALCDGAKAHVFRVNSHAWRISPTTY